MVLDSSFLQAIDLHLHLTPYSHVSSQISWSELDWPEVCCDRFVTHDLKVLNNKSTFNACIPLFAECTKMSSTCFYSFIRNFFFEVKIDSITSISQLHILEL